MKVLLNLFKVGCLLFIVLSCAAMWLLYQSMVPADGEGTRPALVFEVREGASGKEIAEELEQKKVIRSAMAFRLLLRYKGDQGVLKTGYYEVDPKLPALKVFEQLVKGKTLTRKATVPEGLTMAQTAESLEKQDIAPAQEVWAAANAGGSRYGKIYPDNLEGYLFPNTYEFPYQSDGEAAVRTMLGLFEAEVLPMWEKSKGKTGLDLHQTIILASLVEREAQVASERPLIAGVYLNRIKKDMLLQCDATVQFALGKPRAVLTYQDLEVRSPYNTYLYKGLPPGPIASPGKASIEAAMNPKPSNYLFYVRNDVKGDGSHVFTTNYAEHQRAIDKYQR